ncbi:MAG: hypothetical protein ACI9V1_003751 [Spirosomataceae bacterium]|jgi:hypothetical protein
MQTTVKEIEFRELIQLVKSLPKTKLKKLQAEINNLTDKPVEAPKTSLRDLLMIGSTGTEQELEIINQNRKNINQWRSK